MTPVCFNDFLANICPHTSLWVWIIYSQMSLFISSCCIEWLALHYYTVVDMDIHLVKYFWLTGSLEGMYHFVCVYFYLCSGLHMSIYMDAWGRWFSLGHSSINRAHAAANQTVLSNPICGGNAKSILNRDSWTMQDSSFPGHWQHPWWLLINQRFLALYRCD